MSYQSELSRPSPVEAYSSGISGSAWLLFIGAVLVIGSIWYLIANPGLGGVFAVLGAWIIAGVLGFIGFVAISNSLKVERLRLAAHMLRSLSLHAVLAYQKNSNEALQLVGEAEHREKGFIIRMFRAAGANVEQAFAEGVVDGIRRASEPPYILVYRNGVLDAPSTLIANLTARGFGAAFGVIAFILLGLVMLAVSIILSAVLIYTTGRALRAHATRENKVREILGLPRVPTEAPGIGGLVASILTAGLYLPMYARKLAKNIDMHIHTH